MPAQELASTPRRRFSFGGVDGSPHAFEFPSVRPDSGGAHLFAGLFAFSFVRNPWDRLVSCFRDKIQGRATDFTGIHPTRGIAYCLADFDAFTPSMTFERFVDVVAEIRDDEADDHFRSQHRFLVNDEGRIAVGSLHSWVLPYSAPRPRAVPIAVAGLPDPDPSFRMPSMHDATIRLTGLALIVALAVHPGDAEAQAPEPLPERLAVFLDCDGCDETFLRQEMEYLDWVLDREVADVHVLVTDQDTGAGGEALTFDLIGLGPFEGMDHSTIYTVNVAATEAEARDGFLRTLQAMLAPYLLRTSTGERIRIQIEPAEGGGAQQAEPQDDRWDFWTFELYTDASADFESRQRSMDARYGIYVNRVTEDWKIQLRPFFNYNYDRFERSSGVIESYQRRNGFTSYAVKSITPHWSVGAFADVFTSTFDNVDMRYRIMPAVEWSLYPYREATRRQLTVAYRVGAALITYRDSTIFNQIEETLPEHKLNVQFDLTQPWGELEMGMIASQYLQDLERYAVEFNASVEVRITQGLSIELGGNMAFIYNQLNLPKGDADLEEVLLRRRLLETDYEAGFSVGFRYRFGSLFNNVVNPRLNGLGSQDRF